MLESEIGNKNVSGACDKCTFRTQRRRSSDWVIPLSLFVWPETKRRPSKTVTKVYENLWSKSGHDHMYDSACLQNPTRPYNNHNAFAKVRRNGGQKNVSAKSISISTWTNDFKSDFKTHTYQTWSQILDDTIKKISNNQPWLRSSQFSRCRMLWNFIVDPSPIIKSNFCTPPLNACAVKESTWKFVAHIKKKKNASENRQLCSFPWTLDF